MYKRQSIHYTPLVRPRRALCSRARAGAEGCDLESKNEKKQDFGLNSEFIPDMIPNSGRGQRVDSQPEIGLIAGFISLFGGMSDTHYIAYINTSVYNNLLPGTSYAYVLWGCGR